MTFKRLFACLELGAVEPDVGAQFLNTLEGVATAAGQDSDVIDDATQITRAKPLVCCDRSLAVPVIKHRLLGEFNLTGLSHNHELANLITRKRAFGRNILRKRQVDGGAIALTLEGVHLIKCCAAFLGRSVNIRCAHFRFTDGRLPNSEHSFARPRTFINLNTFGCWLLIAPQLIGPRGWRLNGDLLTARLGNLLLQLYSRRLILDSLLLNLQGVLLLLLLLGQGLFFKLGQLLSSRCV